MVVFSSCWCQQYLWMPFSLMSSTLTSSSRRWSDRGCWGCTKPDAQVWHDSANPTWLSLAASALVQLCECLRRAGQGTDPDGIPSCTSGYRSLSLTFLLLWYRLSWEMFESKFDCCRRQKQHWNMQNENVMNYKLVHQPRHTNTFTHLL